jgi:pimeloyl-ACP methyl ester carboxylesterase
MLRLCLNPMVVVDVMWEEPRFVRYLDRLSAFTRHVWFDGLGIGSSASVAWTDRRVVERLTRDMVAVLDAVGEERAILLAWTAEAALLFAATYPARTQALVLIDPTARWRVDDGYDGLDEEEFERMLAVFEQEWGTGVYSQVNGFGTGERTRRWQDKCERLMFTPVRRQAYSDRRWKSTSGRCCPRSRFPPWW